VNAFSTDGTLDICREFTDRIVQHEYINSAKQKNWALHLIASDWVLQIDSDETIEPNLRSEILEAMSRDDQADGYRIRRKNFIWGRWCTSCNYYPDWQLRLFRTAQGKWSDREVHARVEGVRIVKQLKGHLLHRDLESIQAELTQFSTQFMNWEVNELKKRGRRWRWLDVTARPIAIFLVFYFYRGGYREGFRGFFLSVWRAFYSFMTYTLLYESEIMDGLRR
jgi:glycosyltransferase involved in cell wall biosynthesis